MSQKVASSIPDEALGFFNLPNHSSCTITLGMTHSLTEMSMGNLPGGKTWLAGLETDNFTAICDPIV
jgi:hypothetical protein